MFSYLVSLIVHFFSSLSGRIYFYDHGFESNYIPPPDGFITTAFVDSQLIKQTAPDRKFIYDVIVLKLCLFDFSIAYVI